MSASLDKLVSNLTKDGLQRLKNLKEFTDLFDSGCNNKLKLLSRKGVYPYSYIDSVEKFDESLPSKEAFHNDLTDEELSDKDFCHVKSVWREFNLSNLGELHNL